MTTTPQAAPSPAPVLSPPPESDAGESSAAALIDGLRTDITDIDGQILALVARRIELSGKVGALRMAAGGTRLSLSREQVIVDRFTTALGADGTALAMLLLRAGRGRL